MLYPTWNMFDRSSVRARNARGGGMAEISAACQCTCVAAFGPTWLVPVRNEHGVGCAMRYSPIRLRRIPASVFLGRFCPCVFLRIFIPVFVCYMSCLSDAYRNFYLAT